MEAARVSPILLTLYGYVWFVGFDSSFALCIALRKLGPTPKIILPRITQISRIYSPSLATIRALRAFCGQKNFVSFLPPLP
jgi:hypothetical protein